MENKNETVAELQRKCEEYERQPELMAETAKAALELLKAQDSKISELRECLKEAFELICDMYCESENCDCCVRNMKWSKALEGAKDENS